MKNPSESNRDDTLAKKKEMPWLILGIPVGCGIGVALGNLALGVGFGLLLGGTIRVFTPKKEGQNVSPIVKIALVVCLLAILSIGILIKK
jgi:hypothetical protein